MNIVAALDLIIKYGQYIPLLVDAGANIAEAVGRIVSLAQGAKDGAVSDAEIQEHREYLDKLIEEFNSDLPEE